MQPINSGTTTERIVRTTLLTVLINGFAIAFLWDGYTGYARENARQLTRSLGLDGDALPDVNPQLTAAKAQQLIQNVKKGLDAGAVTAMLGEPGLTHADETYYLGPGGHVRVRWDRGRVGSAEWRNAIHSKTDQALQRRIGCALSVLGVALLVNFVRVVTTRVSLTDAGLKVRGRPRIPFAAMRGLRARKPGKNGCVELECLIDGHKGVVRLDSYMIKEFRAIVAAIRERTGQDE